MNIRQFDDLRYVEAIFHIINYASHVPDIEPELQVELERNLRICVEIYLSKIKDVSYLISVLDLLMSAVQEEILTQNDNQMINRLNHTKIRGMVEILINPILYFIKSAFDLEANLGVYGGILSSNKQ